MNKLILCIISQFVKKNTRKTNTYYNQAYSRKDLVEFFISQEFPVSLPNKNLETPLHVACEKGEIEIAIMLIRKSKNLNLQDNSGNTFLHKAMLFQGDNKKIIINLVKNGCDINKTNIKNETPLTFGITYGFASNFVFKNVIFTQF